jgi:hypothetical protein
MQETKGQAVPHDYKKYPGKMDHCSILCFALEQQSTFPPNPTAAAAPQLLEMAPAPLLSPTNGVLKKTNSLSLKSPTTNILSESERACGNEKKTPLHGANRGKEKRKEIREDKSKKTKRKDTENESHG